MMDKNILFWWKERFKNSGKDDLVNLVILELKLEDFEFYKFEKEKYIEQY